MASPIGAAGGVTGQGEQQLKALIQQWIASAIRDNGRGGIGLAPQKISVTTTNFGLTTTPTAILTSSLTVPLGMTSAVVNVTARCLAYDANTSGGSNGAGADYQWAQPFVGAIVGAAMPLNTGGSNGSSINTSPLAVILPGLNPGNTIPIGVNAWTSFLPWAVYSYNTAELQGSISWYR